VGHLGIVAAVLATLALAALVVWARGIPGRREARRRLAAEQFRANRANLEKSFLAAAAATGKPRGLAWTSCRFAGDPLFAVDRRTHDLVALIGATVTFEAIAGGGMEEVEAVGNVRYVTAVFTHRRDAWETDGRAVFNLEPAEALERFGDALEPARSLENAEA
jgi:hypothetical protein